MQIAGKEYEGPRSGMEGLVLAATFDKPSMLCGARPGWSEKLQVLLAAGGLWQLSIRPRPRDDGQLPFLRCSIWQRLTGALALDVV